MQKIPEHFCQITNVDTECICKTFTDNVFHLFSLQYQLIAIKAWLNSLMVLFSLTHSTWLGLEKDCGLG